jgi:hypothetical protein
MHVNKYFYVARMMFSKAFVGVIFCYKTSTVIDAHKWYLCKKSLAIIYTVYIYSEYFVNKWYAHCPETHTKRRATQHGCLPSLLADRDKGIEIVNGEEKNISY